MINQYSLDAVTNAMRVLGQHRARLSPVKGSAIETLNYATNKQTVLDTDINDEQFFETFQASTCTPRPTSEGAGYLDSDSPAAGVLNIDDHEGTLHDLLAMNVDRCDRLTSFARNNMQGLVTRILKNFQPMEEKEITEGWSIQPITVEPLLVDPLVTGLMDKLGDYTRFPMYIEPVDGVLVPAGLELPVTGSATYDNLVTKLLNELSMSPAAALDELFHGDATSPLATSAFTQVRKRILQLLLVAYYVDKPWEDSGLRLVVWQTKLTESMQQIVGWLKRYSAAVVTDAASGIIIRDYAAKDRVVYILDAVLNDYVARGGAPEAIYGLIYLREDGNNSVLGTVDSVLEHQAKLLEAWSQHAVIRRQENRNDWRTINARALKDAVRTAVYSEETTDADLLLGEGRTRDSVVKGTFERIDIYFRAVSEDADLTSLVIQLVGEMCQETLGAELLMRIHTGMRQGGNPEEIATDWMIDYLLDWALEDIDVQFES